MKTDLVLTPFGAAIGDLVAAARIADAGGYDAVWAYDHFSGLAAGKPWARDPFVTLGAIAATTERVGVGVLVANMVNRHPAQLACAVNSLQSLAPGRVVLGIGAGASPGSPFAAEHGAIARPLHGRATREAMLVETIAALRAIWRGEAFSGEHYSVAASMAVTDGTPAPPIVVGASSPATVELGCEHADGVNLLPRPNLAELVALARRRRPGSDFEVSAFAAFDAGHLLGGDPARLGELGVDRRTLAVEAPYPLDAIASVGRLLSRDG